MSRGEKIWMSWGLGCIAILFTAQITEGKIGAAVALAVVYSIGCLAFWLFL